MPMPFSTGSTGNLRELGWLGSNMMVVIVGDGAEWIWNRASWFIRRCEILDFWHAMEHAWEFARLRYGERGRISGGGVGDGRLRGGASDWAGG